MADKQVNMRMSEEDAQSWNDMLEQVKDQLLNDAKAPNNEAVKRVVSIVNEQLSTYECVPNIKGFLQNIDKACQSIQLDAISMAQSSALIEKMANEKYQGKADNALAALKAVQDQAKEQAKEQEEAHKAELDELQEELDTYKDGMHEACKLCEEKDKEIKVLNQTIDELRRANSVYETQCEKYQEEARQAREQQSNASDMLAQVLDALAAQKSSKEE